MPRTALTSVPRDEALALAPALALVGILAAGEAFSTSLWKHAVLFHGALAVLSVLAASGVVHLRRRASPRYRLALGFCVTLLLLSLLPVWFGHHADTPDGVEHHAHTLWTLTHVH